MFIRRYLHPVIFYETPDVTATAAQGQPVAPTVQPTQGQGQPQQGTGNDQFWNMFPNVPEEHRPLLEPTIREQIQPYVTRLEQQLAPFRAFEGVDPQDAAGLLQMAQEFEQDPVGVWLKMGQALAESGEHLQDVDVEYLAQLATGQGVEEPVAGDDANGQLPPELAQYLQPIAGQLQELTQWQQEQVQREQERQRQQHDQHLTQVYSQAAQTVKDQVKASGYPEEALTDEAVRYAIIMSNGSTQGAIKFLVDTRNNMLKGFVQNGTQPAGQKPKVTNGGPKPPKQRQTRGGSRDTAGFDDAATRAKQFLSTRVSADAQG